MDHTLMHRPLPRFNPAPVALAVALVLSLPAMAQTQSAPDSSKVAIAIAAQPLGAALNELSAATGTPIAFPPALVAGKTAPAVKGALTAFQAVAQLLAGSGLSASQDGRTIVIRAVTNASEATLPEVKVTAESARDGTTEGSGSYKARYTNTATKLDLSPRETPQTVTVVTRQQMDDFGMTSVDDALEAASGVFVYNRGNNGSYYYSRGFFLQSQYDGIPNPIGISDSNRNPPIDNAFLDRVEVLQGASGLMSGAGYPGGTINLVRKRPTEGFQAQAEVQLGSWNQRRLVGDVSGPLVESGRIRGRLIALTDESDSFVNFAYNNRRGVYGVVEADLTPTTTVSASVQYQQDKGRSHLGVPFGSDGRDLGLSRSAFFGNPNSQTTKDSTIYTLGLEQQLSTGWRIKGSYSRGVTDADQQKYSYLFGNLNNATGDGLLLYQTAAITQQIKSDAFDVFASGPVFLLGRQHELVIGVSGSSMRHKNQGTGYVPTAINVYNFNPETLPDPALASPNSGNNKITQNGIYGVGRFSLSDSLKLITGARISSYDNTNLITGVTAQKERNVVSPYAGLIYEINKQYSAYVSYSDIFNPQSNKNTTGDTLKPVVGSNYEIGVKGELLGGKLNTAVALFRLEQTNLAKLDESVPYDLGNACGGYCYAASDKVISQGVDLSLNGEISSGWNAAAGYTFVDSKYASGSSDGQRYMTTLPQHSLRLATSYKFSGTGWTLGSSVRVQSRIYNNGSSYSIRQGGLAIVGLTAKYQINSKADLSMVLDNLFDRRYYATVDRLHYTAFGEPRKISVNLKYRF